VEKHEEKKHEEKKEKKEKKHEEKKHEEKNINKIIYYNIMYNFQNLLTVSVIVGLGTSAGTLIGGMIYPIVSDNNLSDWRDIASLAVISAIISSKYSISSEKTVIFYK
tara:strand:- start:1195 stop:1518 length:324 start_codon:yes stop_codon:yes gene_type:complete